MIPSRPLAFGEILGQTFYLFGQVFARYTVFFLLFFVPGIVLVTYGTIDLVQTGVSVAEHDGHFTDQDLLMLRNKMRYELAKDNPAFQHQIEDRAESDTASWTTPMSDSVFENWDQTHKGLDPAVLISNHAGDFAGSFVALLGGALFLLLGLTALNAGVTDLACQAFEERIEYFRQTFRDLFGGNLWRALGIVILLAAASVLIGFVRDAFYSISQGVGLLMGGIILVAELYFSFRFMLAIPAAISEQMGPIQGLRRSWDLTATNWPRLVAIGFVFGVIALGIATVIFVVCSLFLVGSGFLWWRDFLTAPTVTISNFVHGLAGFVRSMAVFLAVPFFVILPLSPIFATVFYYDLRTRIEGPLEYPEDEEDGFEDEGAHTELWRP